MTALSTTLPLRATSRTRPITGALVLTALILAALLPRLGFLARPFESDAGLYIYMGKALAQGQTLYRDFYETKLPGVPLFTAALYHLFGDHWYPYVLLQTAMAIVAALLLARTAAHHLGPAAKTPALLFALVFLNFSPIAYRGFQLETVQTFFATLAAYFALTDDRNATTHPLLAGLFAGLAAMIKPTGAAVAAAHALILLRHRQYRALLTLILGASIAPLAVTAWTWHAGLLPEIPTLLREISLYGSQTPLVPDDLFKPLCVLVIAGFPFLAIRIVRQSPTPVSVPQVAVLRDLCATPPRQTATLLLFATTWLLLECLGVYAQKRMYAYHFLPLAAPLTLLFAAACRTGRSTPALAAAFAPILLLSLARTQYDLQTLLTRTSPNLPQSDYLLAHAAPTDTVIGDPIERLLMETHLRSGTRYAHLFYFANHDTAPTEYCDRFLADCERNHPTWAVFETNRAPHRLRQTQSLPMYTQRPQRAQAFLTACQKIDTYLATHYTPVTDLNGVTIYHRH